MSATLQVRYLTQKSTEPRYSYEFTAIAEEPEEMSEKIFIFQAKVPSINDPSDILEQFVCIATPVDLDEMPEDAPDLANNKPFYRKNSVTLRFKSAIEMDDAKQIMHYDIAKLVKSMAVADNIIAEDVVVYG